MTQFFKKNKWIILFSIILFGILVYCHFQTFIIGDDLAYSLYLRGNDRIDSIKEIIINQMSDYKWINRDFDSFKATKSYKPLKNGCFFVKF